MLHVLKVKGEPEANGGEAHKTKAESCHDLVDDILAILCRSVVNDLPGRNSDPAIHIMASRRKSQLIASI